MSYSICRIAKVKASGVTGIQIHDRREKGVSHTNEDIDWEKTDENVDLLEQDQKFKTVVSERINELDLKRQPRSDATVMCQCLVTSDNQFFDKMSREEQIDYFKKSLKFLEERYGKENMVSATIHYDEKTPHMHVNFVPVTSDGRLSAKDLFSPKSLRQLQDDYNRMCRENGYDLERGELHSKKEHLSVEEYKVATKYEELKDKKAELERVENIDKKADLQAEKGKLGYSTKEVQAIKDQNKSLKIEISKKDRQIEDLQRVVQNVKNRLVKAEKDLGGMTVPLERLKDLESENRAFQSYLEIKPELKKELQTFDNLKNSAYKRGEDMIKVKKDYLTLIDARKESIEKTYELENSVKLCDTMISDLRKRQKDINTTTDHYNGLESELEQTKGIFKGKQRKELQEQLNKVHEDIKAKLDNLKLNYNIEPTEINQKIEEIQENRQEYLKLKDTQIKHTNGYEDAMESKANDYKYMKALIDTQNKDLKNISERIDARINLPIQYQGAFKITKADRPLILERMAKVNPKRVDACKMNFEMQDKQEKQKVPQRKVRSKSISHER